MCGRFTSMYSWRQLHDLYALTSPPLQFAHSYNAAPTQSTPVVRGGPDGRRLDLLRWGLVPSWAKDLKIGSRMINARAETVASNPAFRSPFMSRRCVVPVSGFFEWHAVDGGDRKQPYYIFSTGGEPLSLAGLWERWCPDGADAVESFTIITTAPNEMMAKVHDRMPVILDPADFAAWFDPKATPDAVRALLRPYPAELMTYHPVSAMVNSPRNNVPECVAPVHGVA